MITLLEGDAAEILPTLDETFDFIFMDAAAKAPYIHFFTGISEAARYRRHIGF